MKIFYYVDEMYPVYYPKEGEEVSSWNRAADVPEEVWSGYLKAFASFIEAHDELDKAIRYKMEGNK